MFQRFYTTKVMVLQKEIFVITLEYKTCLATSYSRKGKAFTTIGAEKLNFRVRDGNGCDLLAIITGLFLNNIMYIICCLLFRMGIFILSKLNNVRLFTE